MCVSIIFFVPNRLLWKVNPPDFVSTTASTAYPAVSSMLLSNRNAWETFITGVTDYDDIAINAGVNRPGQTIPSSSGSTRIPLRPPTFCLTQSAAPGTGVDRAPLQSSLWDHLYGIPSTYFNSTATVNNDHPCQVDALPGRAYNLIWNEWYRDQDLQGRKVVDESGGYTYNNTSNTVTYSPSTASIDTVTDMRLLKRNWEKDYFTSCRPWPQKSQDVTIGGTLPTAGTVRVPVRGYDYYNQDPDYPVGTTDPFGTTRTYYQGTRANEGHSVQGSGPVESLYEPNGSSGVSYQVPTGMHSGYLLPPESRTTPNHYAWYVDVAADTGVTVNALRLAIQTQKFMERCARYGTRYVEFILSHFGVRSSDQRLDRPEYLGGGRSPVVFSEVLQTSGTPVTSNVDHSTPQGNMAGHGVAVSRAHAFHKTIEEHGWILGLLSVMPRTQYMQGVGRRFTRFTRFDYYFPEFSHIGEQGVLYRELFCTDVLATNQSVFGYQGRYDEYRRRENVIAGDFRTSLNYWHMARIFDPSIGEPVPSTINSQFVTSAPTTRVFAATTGNQYWIQLWHNLKVARAMPKRATPGLMDHF